MLAGDMTGLESAAIIREKYDVPIIFMSALTDKQTQYTQLNMANTYIMGKPFEETKLLKLLSDIVG
jgi:DNA-binding response OmpR family regulator